LSVPGAVGLTLSVADVVLAYTSCPAPPETAAPLQPPALALSLIHGLVASSTRPVVTNVSVLVYPLVAHPEYDATDGVAPASSPQHSRAPRKIIDAAPPPDLRMRPPVRWGLRVGPSVQD
jgi:hypothetical protein